MRRTKALPAIALLSGAALVLSACSGGGGGSTDGNDDQSIAEMAVARGQSGDGYTAPETKESVFLSPKSITKELNSNNRRTLS